MHTSPNDTSTSSTCPDVSPESGSVAVTCIIIIYNVIQYNAIQSHKSRDLQGVSRPHPVPGGQMAGPAPVLTHSSYSTGTVIQIIRCDDDGSHPCPAPAAPPPCPGRPPRCGPGCHAPTAGASPSKDNDNKEDIAGSPHD